MEEFINPFLERTMDTTEDIPAKRIKFTRDYNHAYAGIDVRRHKKDEIVSVPAPEAKILVQEAKAAIELADEEPELETKVSKGKGK